MKPSSKVVVFTENNARVLHGEDGSLWAHTPNVVINPDLEKVRGTPPHLWKLEDGKILPMTDSEKQEREKHIAYYGVQNSHSFPEQRVVPTPKAPSPYLKSAGTLLLGCLLGFLIRGLFGK